MTDRAGPSRAARLSLPQLCLHGGVYILFWLILSGHYDLFHLTLGAISIGLVLFINRDSFLLPRGAKPVPIIRPLRLVLYALWLGKEMILAAVSVAKTVLSPRMEISPGLVRFRSDQPTDMARVILGNSITLTPGTLTLDIDKNAFLVHHLTAKTAEELVEGSMPRRVAELYGPVRGRMVYDVEKR